MASADRMAQTDLDAAIRSGDDDRIADALNMIGRSGSVAELDLIKELAKETRFPVVRNAAAIALADLNAEGADELLTDLVRRKETRGANGTLLYALRELNAYVPLSVLIDILTEDRTYEALEGALDIIANNAARYGAAEKAEAVSRTVAALIGDGSFLYNPVVQALGASKGNDLPILIVVCNNGQYRAMQVGHQHHYPDGVAQEAEIWHGVAIDGPDYAELGKPFGFAGRKVERPAELPGAIRNAMREVESGKTAILNVVLSR